MGHDLHCTLKPGKYHGKIPDLGISIQSYKNMLNSISMAKLSGKALGSWGESIAADYLTEKGYQIIKCNYRTPYGEIDLVTRYADVTIFVEVKTRSNAHFGFPEDAITAAKRQHLIEASQFILQKHPELDGDWRIDVIAIQSLDSSNQPLIEHFENAVN